MEKGDRHKSHRTGKPNHCPHLKHVRLIRSCHSTVLKNGRGWGNQLSQRTSRRKHCRKKRLIVAIFNQHRQHHGSHRRHDCHSGAGNHPVKDCCQHGNNGNTGLRASEEILEKCKNLLGKLSLRHDVAGYHKESDGHIGGFSCRTAEPLHNTLHIVLTKPGCKRRDNKSCPIRKGHGKAHADQNHKK